MCPKFLMLFLMLALCSAGQPAEHAPLKVVAVEALPLSLHTRVLMEVAALLGPDNIRFTRVSALSEGEGLNARLKASWDQGARHFVVFAPELAEAVQASAPDAAVVNVFSTEEGADPAAGLWIDPGPQPEEIWQAATSLRGAHCSLGMVFTRGLPANERLLECLKSVTPAGCTVHPVLVDPGYCRTEADFDLAVRQACEHFSLDVLFVPEDPNCAKFGRTIFAAARTAQAASIGTQETAGQGNDLALVISAPAMAEAIGRALAQYRREHKLPAGHWIVPREMQLAPAPPQAVPAFSRETQQIKEITP